MSIYSEEYISEGLSHPLFVRRWLPDGEIHGVVQLCHGMAEHSSRYEKLGCYLADHGYAAFCHDHRGHGKSCLKGETLGYFAERGGWDLLTDDILTIGSKMRSEYCDGPFILFGHSMGSLLVSTVAALGRTTEYNAFILCGSPAPNAMAPAGMALAKAFCKVGMAKTPNTFLHALAFADINKLFHHEKSGNAWLSSDREQVSKYDRDPLCGFRFTSSGFYDLFDGISRVRNKGWAVKTECKPFLLISGDKDPIGGVPAVNWLTQQLEAVGRDVRHHLYKDKRHEILNEKDCGQVYTDIMTWILEIEGHE